MKIRLKRRQFGQWVMITTVITAFSEWFKPRPLVANPKPQPQTSPMLDASAINITLKVNGVNHSLKLEPRVTLLDALREYLGLTGTKKGCNQGACGSCTVLVNGQRINSCLTLAVMNSGKEITTIEGLATGDTLHPLQTAFLEYDAFQCGFCTPGQICSAVALLKEGHTHSDAEIQEWMSGNLCRCGAYPNIVSAIREVASRGNHATI